MPTKRPERESTAARQAYVDWLALGSERSLEALAVAYQGRTGAVPTRQLSRLKIWSSTFQWRLRLRGIADQEAAEAERRHKAERKRVLDDGLGRDYERVRSLKRQALRLEAAILAVPLLRPDPKQAGRILEPEQYAIEKTVRLLRELRGLFADIAQETGGRRLAEQPREPLSDVLLAEALALGLTEAEARALWDETPDPP